MPKLDMLKGLGKMGLRGLDAILWPLLAYDVADRFQEGFEPARRMASNEDRGARFLNAYNEIDAIGGPAADKTLSNMMGRYAKQREDVGREVSTGVRNIAQRDRAFLDALTEQHQATFESLSQISQPSLMERYAAQGLL